MRYALAILAVSGLLSAPYARAEDHLAPCGDFLKGYENRVDAIAHGAMPGKVDFWVTVIPSFEPEWSIGVSTSGNQHFLTYVVFDRSLWHGGWASSGPNTMRHDSSSGHTKPKARTVPISQSLHQAIRSEWDRSIKSSRPSEILGLDGISYNFKLPDQCAKAWSPEPNTRNNKLVALVESLRILAKGNAKSSKTDENSVRATLRELSQP